MERPGAIATAELDYELPPALIAQRPLERRDGAGLLVVHRAIRTIEHRQITDLPRLLAPALFVVNDTRVIAARLHGVRPTGGRVELLLLGRLEGDATAQRWRALGHASKRLTIGSRVVLAEGRLEALVEGRSDDPGRAILEVRLSSRGTEAIDELLRRYGTLPLPPYIEHVPDAADEDRYQTLFAREPGAVAAPTAGLHFSETLMADMRAAGHEFAAVTLHVGLGTFAPIRAARLEDHVMHRERFRVPPETARAIGEAQSAQHPVVAIGTTVVRSLESAVQEDGRVVAIEGEASLFIRPPYRFRAFDHLLTNFHLPRSTLLALVMAFGGIELVREAYRVAVDAEYRFFSYGDAMLVL